MNFSKKRKRKSQRQEKIPSVASIFKKRVSLHCAASKKIKTLKIQKSQA